MTDIFYVVTLGSFLLGSFLLGSFSEFHSFIFIFFQMSNAIVAPKSVFTVAAAQEVPEKKAYGPLREKKYSAWNEACRKFGVKSARKGTPAYDAVMKVYREMNPEPLIPNSWAWCCKELGFGPVKKGSDEYLQVMKKFKEANPREETPESIMWSDACKEAGVEFARRGTPEYEQVLAIYISKAEATENQSL